MAGHSHWMSASQQRQSDSGRQVAPRGCNCTPTETADNWHRTWCNAQLPKHGVVGGLHRFERQDVPQPRVACRAMNSIAGGTLGPTIQWSPTTALGKHWAAVESDMAA
jgi:hypothetical protein